MIICFDSKNNKLKSIISGKNPIPSYNETISYLDIPDQHILAKKGDIVSVDKKNNTVKIGPNVLFMDHEEHTIITFENYLEPIILEEL